MMDIPPPDAVWRTWFHDHGARLLLCARQWARCAADAEDLVQEAFVRYWRHQRHLPGEPFALIVTSLRRAALDRAREQDRRAAREDQVARAEAAAEGGEPWFESPVGSDAFADHEPLENAVRRLPPEQREVLVLKIWGELTFAEIADQLDLSPHTAASRYRYALTALRRHLTPSPVSPASSHV